MITQEWLLKVPVSDPGKLFSHDPTERKSQYHILVKQWHPDMRGGSTEVFHHIQALYEAAESGRWDGSQELVVRNKGGNKGFNIRYKVKHPYELGDVYISKTLVTWFIKKEHEDLARNGIKTLNSIKYPDERIKKEHERYIPVIKHTVATEDGLYLVMPKPEDLILLDDLINHLGRLPPKHMAWVVSSLLNILCFYQITGLTHNGLTTDNVFVNAKRHSVFPFGGWWYSKRAETTLKYLPPKVYRVAPSEVLARKAANIRVDLAAVKLIARTSIADPTGARLSNTGDIPKALANWLRLPPLGNAIQEYKLWGQVLTDSWGPRRFLQLDVDPSAIYK